MGRAEYRRAAKQAKKGNAITRIEPMTTVEMSPARIAMMERRVADDLIRRYGDKAAIEYARRDGYEQGWSEGNENALKYYTAINFACIFMAASASFGFRSIRLDRIYNLANKYYNVIEGMIENGLDLDEAMLRIKVELAHRTGFGLKIEEEEVRKFDEEHPEGTGLEGMV